MVVILGFTGTREGMTQAQRAALPSVVSALPERIIHGGARGADAELHAWLLMAGMAPGSIDVWPASLDRWSFYADTGAVVHPIAAPLARDHIIAKNCDRLLATPRTMTEIIRSGTWATIRYARKARKPITIVLPNGTIREERWC